MENIVINDRWSIKRDAYSWQLTESTRYIVANDTKTAKKGEERVSHKETWHSTILQACKKIVNTEAKDGEDVAGIIEAVERAEENIVQALIRTALENSHKPRAATLHP